MYEDRIRPSDAFSLERLPAGRWRIRARAGAWIADPVREIALGEGESVRDVRITMVRGASVRGVVRNAAGATVAGADVHGLDGTILGPRGATTGADGSFLVEGFHAGEVQLSAAAPDGGSLRGFATVRVALGETAEVEIVLK